MDPKDLVRRLIDAQGETPNSVVHLTRPPMQQSTLHRYLKSNTGETRRKSLAPLAAYFGVPIEAFYDPRVADQVAKEKGLGDTATVVAARDNTHRGYEAQTPAAILARLADILRHVPSASRAPIGALLDRWAQAGGAASYQSALETLLKNEAPKPD
jgi:hypothetical protein